MKTLTKKQRREIYLKVARIIEQRGFTYICLQLQTLGYRYHDLENEFLEFFLFEPSSKEQEGALAWWYRYNDSEYNKNVRIICMLLCAEMCKP